MNEANLEATTTVIEAMDRTEAILRGEEVTRLPRPRTPEPASGRGWTAWWRHWLRTRLSAPRL